MNTSELKVWNKLIQIIMNNNRFGVTTINQAEKLIIPYWRQATQNNLRPLDRFHYILSFLRNRTNNDIANISNNPQFEEYDQLNRTNTSVSSINIGL